MTAMSGRSDLNNLAKVMMVLGALCLLGGLLRFVTAPAELPFPSHGDGGHAWFEASEAHDKAVFVAVALAMLGAFLLAGGAILSKRGRGMAFAVAEQRAEAVARGAASGLGLHGAAPAPDDVAARLARIDKLHADGVLTDAEHAAKRKELVDKL